MSCYFCQLCLNGLQLVFIYFKLEPLGSWRSECVDVRRSWNGQVVFPEVYPEYRTKSSLLNWAGSVCSRPHCLREEVPADQLGPNDAEWGEQGDWEDQEALERERQGGRKYNYLGNDRS